MSDKKIPGPAGTLHIDDGGSGGIPVMFLHSFAGSSSHWSSQLMHLRRTRRALALDFRGHGQSDPPADNDYSIEGMTADLSAALDVSGIKKVLLVGHSMGGSVAAAYAGAHADDIAGLVLVETPGKTSKDQARQIMQSIESNYDKVMQDYWDKLLQNAQPQTATQIKAEMGRLSRPV